MFSSADYPVPTHTPELTGNPLPLHDWAPVKGSYFYGNKLHLWVPCVCPGSVSGICGLCLLLSLRRTMERSWDSCFLSRGSPSATVFSSVWPYVLVIIRTGCCNKETQLHSNLKNNEVYSYLQIGYKLSSLSGQPAPLPTVNQEPMFLSMPWSTFT